jgi:hypothetical protein
LADRSSGITDLRHSHVLAADWDDRFNAPDARQHLPLPAGVACSVAGTIVSRCQTLPLPARY